MDKKSMLEAMISHYTNGNKAKFATFLGVSAQTISAWTARNTFDTELIYAKCSCISADWLLSGEGSMFIKDGVQQPRESVSASSDAVTMRLMDKLDQKESQIDHLQSELRAMGEELATLKAQVNNQLSAEESPSMVEEVIEAFTKAPSGGSIKDSIHTRKPTTSLGKSSAAKT